MKNCRVLVTGGAGFIGQNLVKKLLEFNNEVVVLDGFKYGATRKVLSKDVYVVEGDVRDFSKWTKAISGQVDYIFHLAAPSSIILFKENEFECMDITINGFLNAVTCAHDFDARLVYPSTGSLYAGAQTPNAEDTNINFNVINSYARGKYALESIQFAFKDTVDILATRIFAGYGPEEKQKGNFASVLYTFIRDMKQGKAPIIWGDGTQTRDFVYVTDVADIMIKVAEDIFNIPVINIGSGQTISFNMLVDIINEQLGTSIKPEYINKPHDYLQETLCDTTLMNHNRLTTKVDIKTGIKNIIESL